MSAELGSGNSVMIIGSGGREAALAEAYAKSDHVDGIIAVPGNPTMEWNTDGKPVTIYPQFKTTDAEAIRDIALNRGVSLVDVAQDAAVEVGVADFLRDAGVRTLGPSREAGEIEWSKAFSRGLLKGEVRQPEFEVFSSVEAGLRYLEEHDDQPWYVKASGGTEGKGALPAVNNAQAKKRIDELKRFGAAGQTYVLEGWMRNPNGTNGEEFSLFVLTDGENFQTLGTAQDNKTAYNFDEGPNTGGMGSSTSPLVLTPELLRDAEEGVARKIIDALRENGRRYNGVLYASGIVYEEGGEDVVGLVEVNSRWGDNEAEALVPGITNDFYEMSMAAATNSRKDHGDISGLKIQRDGLTRVALAGASRGYPGDYSAVKGREIFGLADVRRMQREGRGVGLYSAGIRVGEDGRNYANGGRLFHVVGEGETIFDARENAYSAMSHVSVDGNNLHYRTDIGWRDVQRLRSSV